MLYLATVLTLNCIGSVVEVRKWREFLRFPWFTIRNSLPDDLKNIQFFFVNFRVPPFTSLLPILAHTARLRCSVMRYNHKFTVLLFIIISGTSLLL